MLFAAALCFFAPRWLVIPWLPPQPGAILLLELQRVGVACGVVWICWNQTSGIVRALEWPPLRYVGRISYGVYLWQGLFLRNGPADPAGWFHRFPFNVGLTFAVAAASFELVERRFLTLKSRLDSPRRDRRHVREGPVNMSV